MPMLILTILMNVTNDIMSYLTDIMGNIQLKLNKTLKEAQRYNLFGKHYVQFLYRKRIHRLIHVYFVKKWV